MTARRALLALGSLWELARFFLVLSILALMVRSFGGGGAASVPWLLLAGTGNLLVPVGGLMLAMFPGRYGNLVGLLRLGKGLSVFSILILFASGSLATAVNSALLVVGGRTISAAAVLLLLFALDLAFLALLVFSREKDAPR